MGAFWPGLVKAIQETSLSLSGMEMAAGTGEACAMQTLGIGRNFQACTLANTSLSGRIPDEMLVQRGVEGEAAACCELPPCGSDPNLVRIWESLSTDFHRLWILGLVCGHNSQLVDPCCACIIEHWQGCVFRCVLITEGFKCKRQASPLSIKFECLITLQYSIKSRQE